MLPNLPEPPPESPPWQRWTSRALDFLYPPRCAVCGTGLTDGRSLCGPCGESLPRLEPPFCDRCGESFPGQIDDTFSCPNCATLKLAFSFARPAMVRDERTLDMIHRLKYAREIHLAPELARLAAESFNDPRLAPAIAGNWPLVPVPLHRGRFQERHFNQAEEIGKTLSHLTGLPLLPALARLRSTGHQTSLSRSQRLENLRGAFAPTPGGLRWVKKSPAGVVLIDDVFTTGSTINECAKTLRKAGFRAIHAVTVMRG